MTRVFGRYVQAGTESTVEIVPATTSDAAALAQFREWRALNLPATWAATEAALFAAWNGGRASRWTSVGDSLPPDETPVLILLDGEVRFGEIRWDHPSYEDTYESYRYWDDPNDDGQGWTWDEVTHWMRLPEALTT